VPASAGSNVRPPARLLEQQHLGDLGSALESPDRVVNGQRGDRRGSHRPYLDPALPRRPRLGGQRDRARLGVDRPSTPTNVSGSGWHSGISSAVRLAASMPAIRATPRTSPWERRRPQPSQQCPVRHGSRPAPPPAVPSRASRLPLRSGRGRRSRDASARSTDRGCDGALRGGDQFGDLPFHPLGQRRRVAGRGDRDRQAGRFARSRARMKGASLV
jgi:hypothetical protein